MKKITGVLIVSLLLFAGNIYKPTDCTCLKTALYNALYLKRVITCAFKSDTDGIKNETQRFFISSAISGAKLTNAILKVIYDIQ